MHAIQQKCLEYTDRTTRFGCSILDLMGNKFMTWSLMHSPSFMFPKLYTIWLTSYSLIILKRAIESIKCNFWPKRMSKMAGTESYCYGQSLRNAMVKKMRLAIGYEQRFDHTRTIILNRIKTYNQLTP